MTWPFKRGYRTNNMFVFFLRDLLKNNEEKYMEVAGQNSSFTTASVKVDMSFNKLVDSWNLRPPHAFALYLEGFRCT
jgi:hypothetical protein